MIDNNKVTLCAYGCGKKAIYKFKNGKWCCSRSPSGCPEIRKKIGKPLRGKTISEKVIKKRKKTCLKKYGVDNPSKLKKTIEKIKKTCLKKYGVDNVSKLGKIKGKLRLSIRDIKKQYPFFSQIEEMRYDPDKPGEKEIQVHCKNHLCPNSKEKGGWFTPTKEQFKARKDWLENEGKDICYFYCSEKCKEECPLYQSKGGDPFKNIDIIYTQKEYQQFRKFILERDNYKCQYCGKKATEVHHERPQKLEPFFALDPDLAWSCCKKCHYKYGHKTGTECSTGTLASKICN